MNDEQHSARQIAEQASARMHARDQAAQALGITIESVGPGTAELHMTVLEAMLNGHDLCHGGILFSLADTAFAHACNSYGEICVAGGCSIDYTRPAKSGEKLVAVASERWRGRRQGLYDVSVSTMDGALIAMFRGRSHATGKPIVDAGLARPANDTKRID